MHWNRCNSGLAIIIIPEVNSEKHFLQALRLGKTLVWGLFQVSQFNN
jgi:hypothetical protein